MAEVQNNNQNNSQHNDSVINLSEINLIKDNKPKHKFFALVFKKLEAKEIMLVRDNIFNGDARIELKKSGIRTYNPWFQTTYIVDKSLFNINVRNVNSANGLYSLDIGAGDDITVPLRIRARVSTENRSLRKLMIAKDNYKQNIRAAAETMMKLIVQSNYRNDTQHENTQNNTNVLNVLAGLKRRFNVNEMLHSNEPKLVEAANVAMDLLDRQGIVIEEIDMVDADFSERVKQIRTENIEAENKRKRAELESKTKIQIALNEAKAEKIRLQATIEAFKEKGFTDAEIANYYLLQQLPQNAIISTGNNSNITDFMTAGMALNNRQQNNNQNSNGRRI